MFVSSVSLYNRHGQKMAVDGRLDAFKEQPLLWPGDAAIPARLRGEGREQRRVSMVECEETCELGETGCELSLDHGRLFWRTFRARRGSGGVVFRHVALRPQGHACLSWLARLAHDVLLRVSNLGEKRSSLLAVSAWGGVAMYSSSKSSIKHTHACAQARAINVYHRGA